jgi:flagellar hook-length control protein FliK
MNWQIDEPKEQRDGSGRDSDDGSEKWQTRLRLTLPTLGEVDARLHIQGTQITLAVAATDSGTRTLLRDGAASLRIQLEQAGLDLTSIGITAPPEMQPGSQGPG